MENHLLLKCGLHLSSWRLKCIVKEIQSKKEMYSQRNSVGTDRKYCSRKFMHHMKLKKAWSLKNNSVFSLQLLKLLKLKNNSITALQLLKFLILKKGLCDFLTTLKVINAKKGLYHFLMTLKVFNTEKWLHDFLWLLKLIKIAIL